MNHSVSDSNARSPISSPQADAHRRSWWALLSLVWVALMALGLGVHHGKLVVISAMALAAMLLGWLLAELTLPAGRRGLAITDGLAAGTMIASACLFLLPSALHGDPRGGGLGVCIGLLLGMALDRLLTPHRPHRAGGDSALISITVHAAAAGAAMGLAYTAVPTLSVSLGLVIIAHKLPAGFAIARMRKRIGHSRLPLLAPSCAVGLVAIPVAIWAGHSSNHGDGLLSGLATGIFLHVGLDFSRQSNDETPINTTRFIGAAAAAALVVAAARFGWH
ncbi:ZIP family metal transporter [Oleiagrimonas sp. C23AA]|uniref:ZIP family metal transporter n=1 Tax=Oleiagrimonas sp. C23AA TaxID=2719047 RepID=UPI0014214A57|nr:ZIP family metal transporter [Oleiagrimonas sp. C23AA]NII09514.1 ZIP family metal transporter [Oleiagrimonas sp. C23AA]